MIEFLQLRAIHKLLKWCESLREPFRFICYLIFTLFLLLTHHKGLLYITGSYDCFLLLFVINKIIYDEDHNYFKHKKKAKKVLKYINRYFKKKYENNKIIKIDLRIDSSEIYFLKFESRYTLNKNHLKIRETLINYFGITNFNVTYTSKNQGIIIKNTYRFLIKK